VIAHACGVRSPRELRRFHAHVVQPNGLTIALNELYPELPLRPIALSSSRDRPMAAGERAHLDA
jgi:hypothetical protein